VRSDSEFGILTTLRVERPGNRDLSPGTEENISFRRGPEWLRGPHISLLNTT